MDNLSMVYNHLLDILYFICGILVGIYLANKEKPR